MSQLKWIKLNTDIMLNRKIIQILNMPKGCSYFSFWIFLLTGCKKNENGNLIFVKGRPYDRELFHADSNFDIETIGEALDIFVNFRMLSYSKGCYKIKNWKKYQYASRYEEEKRKNLERVKRSREKSKIMDRKNGRPINRTLSDEEILNADDKDLDEVELAWKRCLEKPYISNKN